MALRMAVLAGRASKGIKKYFGKIAQMIKTAGKSNLRDTAFRIG